MSFRDLLRRAAGRGDDGSLSGLPRRDPATFPSHELVLYKFDTCPYCRRVMRVIEALGVPVTYRDTRRERRWREDLLERTGRTQVPCLLIDGEPLFESADISAWLREHYG